MSLRLCIECGRTAFRDPLPDAPCVDCGARAPAWKAVPLGLGDVLRRLVMATKLAAAAAVAVASVYGIWVIASRPHGNPWWLEFALIMVLGLAVGGAIVYVVERGLGPIVEREHRHEEPEGDRGGVTHTRFGRVVRGRGRATRGPEPFVPEAPGLAAAAIFAHARDVNLRLGLAMSISQPPAVDAAVLGALLGLAARGRCVLLVRTTRSWEVTALTPQWTPPRLERRFDEQHTWLVRRVESGRERALDEGWVEGALLAALDALSMGGAPPPARATGPYRAATGAPSAPAGEGAAVPLPALLQALAGGRENPRGWLKGILRGEVRRGRGRSAPDPEMGDALGQELVSTFRGKEKKAQFHALLAQVGAGLAGGERGSGGAAQREGDAPGER